MHNEKLEFDYDGVRYRIEGGVIKFVFDFEDKKHTRYQQLLRAMNENKEEILKEVSEKKLYR